jgi:hypothetical protein
MIVDNGSTPVYISKVDVDPYLEELIRISNTRIMVSSNRYQDINNEPQHENVLSFDSLAGLREQVLQHLNEYSKSIMLDDLQFDIKKSWTIAMVKGTPLKPHKHALSTLSGSLYWEDSDVPLYIKSTFYPNRPVYRSFPNKGKIVIFPSTALHWVGVNNHDKYRTSLAFDAMIKI